MSTHFRVVIFTSFFEEHIGYQEVQLSRVLRRLNHDVLVVATDRSNLYPKMRYTNAPPSHVLRIRRVLRIRNTFLPLESIRNEIASFDPEIALVIHPGSGLPYFYLSTLPEKCKVISFFGDLEVVNKIGKADGIKGNEWVQKTLKDRWYNKTFRRSSVIVANTNETADILHKIARSSIEHSIQMPGLGFDPEIYFPSPELRLRTRKDLGFDNGQIVLLTVTRVYSGKPIREWVRLVVDQLHRNPNLVYIFAGFMDTIFSRTIKRELGSLNLGRQLRLLDFTSAEYNNALFNAADYSLWFIPTISIQQSMATGLPAIVPFDRTTDHLIETNMNGRYYTSMDELSVMLSKIDHWIKDRSEVAFFNNKFSYPFIIDKLFNGV